LKVEAVEKIIVWGAIFEGFPSFCRQKLCVSKAGSIGLPLKLKSDTWWIKKACLEPHMGLSDTQPRTIYSQA